MAGMSDKTPSPTEIKLHQTSRVLEIAFADGRTFKLPYEFLRVYSPSAEVRGHGPGQEVLQTGKRDVTINDVEAVGHYAIRPRFSDGHDTGIYFLGLPVRASASAARTGDCWDSATARLRPRRRRTRPGHANVPERSRAIGYTRHDADKTHFGFEQVDVDEKARRVRGVFDSVARRYDLMNDLMSARPAPAAGSASRSSWPGCARRDSVLDLAGGTGDLARLFAERRRADRAASS